MDNPTYTCVISLPFFLLLIKLFILKYQKKMTGNYLITTDNWFYAPDGKSYRSVWGFVEIVQDSFLGVKTNAHSSNWFAKIGTENNHIVVAGCQIHYAVKCEICPNLLEVEEYNADAANGINKYIRPSTIYAAF